MTIVNYGLPWSTMVEKVWIPSLNQLYIWDILNRIMSNYKTKFFIIWLYILWSSSWSIYVEFLCYSIVMSVSNIHKGLWHIMTFLNGYVRLQSSLQHLSWLALCQIYLRFLNGYVALSLVGHGWLCLIMFDCNQVWLNMVENDDRVWLCLKIITFFDHGWKW